MEWTIRSFQRLEEMWKKRAEQAESSGQKAYAWKQSSTWRQWAGEANDTLVAL